MTLQQKTICLLLLQDEIDEGLSSVDMPKRFFSCRQFESWKGVYISGNKRVAPMVGAGDVRVSLHVCGVLTSGSHMWF